MASLRKVFDMTTTEKLVYKHDNLANAKRIAPTSKIKLKIWQQLATHRIRQTT